jgi:hypothetical protein
MEGGASGWRGGQTAWACTNWALDCTQRLLRCADSQAVLSPHCLRALGCLLAPAYAGRLSPGLSALPLSSAFPLLSCTLEEALLLLSLSLSFIVPESLSLTEPGSHVYCCVLCLHVCIYSLQILPTLTILLPSGTTWKGAWAHTLPLASLLCLPAVPVLVLLYSPAVTACYCLPLLWRRKEGMEEGGTINLVSGLFCEQALV